MGRTYWDVGCLTIRLDWSSERYWGETVGEKGDCGIDWSNGRYWEKRGGGERTVGMLTQGELESGSLICLYFCGEVFSQ